MKLNLLPQQIPVWYEYSYQRNSFKKITYKMAVKVYMIGLGLKFLMKSGDKNLNIGQFNTE